MQLKAVLQAVLIVLAWIGLAAFNAVALIAAGGWVGPADALIPWSAVAVLLWLWTRAALEFRPLYSHWGGRGIIVVWVLAFGLAVAGIDERAWVPSSDFVGWTYVVLPILPGVLVLGALIVRMARRRLTGAWSGRALPPG